MDKQKLLEYALYGANEKAFEYLKKSDKATTAIKYDMYNNLNKECADDADEIKRMISELSRKGME